MLALAWVFLSRYCTIPRMLEEGECGIGSPCALDHGMGGLAPRNHGRWERKLFGQVLVGK